MPRLRTIVQFLAIAFAPALAYAQTDPAHAQTDPALWRFVHPNAKALISIDWHRLSHSNAGAILRDKFINTGGASIPGIEFLDDVDRFVISSPGRNSADANAEPPMLIVARGRFDIAKVRHALTAHGAKAQMFNAIAVYRPQGKTSKDMAFAVLDPQTILIGDARSIYQCLDLNRTPEAAPTGPLAARATEMDANYEVWAILQGSDSMAGNRLTELFSGGALGGAEPQIFEAGISVRNGLLADIHLTLPSEASAQHLASDLTRLFKLAVKDKAGDPALLELEKKLKVTNEGAIAKISLRMTPQELEKSVRTFAAAHPAAPPQAPVVALRPAITPTPTAVAAPPKPERNVIRIEGLDDGIREIPYKPDHQ